MEFSRSSHQHQIAFRDNSHLDSIYVAQYGLKEAFEHAKTVESQLFDLQAQLRIVNDEIERVKSRIRLQVAEGQRLDGSIIEARIRHDERIQELNKRIAYLREETTTDRDEKIRLLKIIDMYVNGEPAPTLADWSFYRYVNQVGYVGASQSKGLIPGPSPEHRSQNVLTTGSEAALSFARTMGSLPESNGWLLDRQSFFQFALALLNSGVLQHRRGYRVDLESNAISAAVTTDVNIALVQTLSAIDEMDLFKL